MMQALAHRGPDGMGLWKEDTPTPAVVLGHTRLAVIDLSPAAAQPMVSANGRSVITYSGEIFNFKELRDELVAMGRSFRTRSDTEVLVQALGVWGTDAFARLNGMWALAVVDTETRELLLARDRLGVKPLYYLQTSGQLLFASEIKAILAAAPGKLAINAATVGRYLDQFLLDTDDTTMFEGVRQLPAAHFVRLPLDSPGSPLQLQRYWRPRLEESTTSRPAAIEGIRTLLESAVCLRLRADVPCGVLLSGGIDSSAIAAAMVRVGGREQVTALGAVADDPRFDESRYIDRVADHLGLHVTKLNLGSSASDLWSWFERATWHHDEPLLGLSAVAHLHLMEEARQRGVTVVLSGQGADELFCGYRKYVPFYAASLLRQRRYGSALAAMAPFVARGTVLSQFSLTESVRYLPRALRGRRESIAGERVRAAQREIVVGLNGSSIRERQLRDLTELSVPLLLHYEDRMSMAEGREIRLPFLDYRLVEAALPLPDNFKLHRGWTKWALRKAIEPWLPPDIVWRKEKFGFTVPEVEWLRSTMRPQVEQMLAGDMLAHQAGLLDQDTLGRHYRQFLRRETRTVAFRDVFTGIALEVWMQQFAAYLRW